MKTIRLIAILIISISFSACNLSGQAPNGMRFTSECYMTEEFLKQGDALLNNQNAMWDPNGDKQVIVHLDANGDNVNDSYSDAMGSTRDFVMNYNVLYNMIHSTSNFSRVQLPNAFGKYGYKMSLDIASTMLYTNVNPNSPNSSNTKATKFCAISASPL